MPNQTCTNILKVCALRSLRLAASGAIEVGADSMYVLDSPILVGYTPQRPTRERFEQIDGCGNTSGLFQGTPKAVDSVALRMDLPVLDAEQIEMLCGGSLITDGAYGTIGYDAPTDSTVNEFGTAIETWSIAWNGRQRAVRLGQPAWYRHVFPKTSWEPTETTLQNGFSTISLTGVGEVNSAFGAGLATDPMPLAIGDTAYRWFLDTEKPAGACGYQAVA